MTNTVLLLSGGVDSAALAYSLHPDLAVTIDYGQVPTDAEIQASKQICKELDLPHTIIEADCGDLGTGSMADREQIDAASTPEWWPFRNQLLITLAAMHAVKIDADLLIFGAVQSDNDHADGRSEFFELMDKTVSFQEGTLNVSTPAIDQTSTELVQESGAPLDFLAWAHSCHTSNNACGECRGCTKRSRVMREVFDSYL